VIAQLVSLDSLHAGQAAIIEDVAAGSDDDCRLAEMGLCCGNVVRMLRPGSPCAVQIDGARIMLRGDHLRGILVSPL